MKIHSTRQNIVAFIFGSVLWGVLWIGGILLSGQSRLPAWLGW